MMTMAIPIPEAVALGVQWRGNATQHSSHEDLPQLETHRSELLSREEAVIRYVYSQLIWFNIEIWFQHVFTINV